MDAKHVNVLIGSGHSLDHIPGRPVIVMSYKTDNGDFTMEFCFEE